MRARAGRQCTARVCRAARQTRQRGRGQLELSRRPSCGRGGVCLRCLRAGHTRRAPLLPSLSGCFGVRAHGQHARTRPPRSPAGARTHLRSPAFAARSQSASLRAALAPNRPRSAGRAGRRAWRARAWCAAPPLTHAPPAHAQPTLTLGGWRLSVGSQAPATLIWVRPRGWLRAPLGARRARLAAPPPRSLRVRPVQPPAPAAHAFRDGLDSIAPAQPTLRLPAFGPRRARCVARGRSGPKVKRLNDI